MLSRLLREVVQLRLHRGPRGTLQVLRGASVDRIGNYIEGLRVCGIHAQSFERARDLRESIRAMILIKPHHAAELRARRAVARKERGMWQGCEAIQ